VYRTTGDFARAEDLYRQALDIYRYGLDHIHLDCAATLKNYSLLQRMEGQKSLALHSAHQAVDIALSVFRENCYVLAEPEALSFASTVASMTDNYFSCYYELDVESRPAEQGAAVALATKGLVTDEMLRRQQSLFSAAGDSVSQLAVSLQSAKYRLAKLQLRGPGEDLERFRADKGALMEKTRELEKSLALMQPGRNR